MHLTPGQNIPLPVRVLRFTASSAAPLDVSALVTDAALRAPSSDSFVFYNHPETAGVRLGVDGVEIDLDAVHADAGAVLCIVSIDPDHADHSRALEDLSATLHDADGGTVATFEMACTAGESAVICWELYWRGGQWKVRAVGQGYRGGLAELLTVHGVEVDDDQPAATHTPATHPVAATPSHTAIEPLDPNRTLERFEMILEDGARSASTYVDAAQFAAARLDQEASDAVADPSTRNTPGAAEAVAAAQRRHDTLVSAAHARYSQDSDHLIAELRTIDRALPRPFAAWDSPAWSTPQTPAPTGDGLRIGELSAPERGPLRIPLCLPYPLRQPLWVLGSDTPATADVVFAIVLRALAADPVAHLDVIDLSGSLNRVTTAMAPRRHGTLITDVDSIAGYLESVSAAIELAILDRINGHIDSNRPGRVVVLNHFPFGYGQSHWESIRTLAGRGQAAGLSLVVVGEGLTSESDHAEIDFARRCYPLSTTDQSEWRDPWTLTEWAFSPDRIPGDATHVRQLLERFGP